MKPTTIPTPLRTITLAYQNDKAPNAVEQRVIAAYPELHKEHYRLEQAHRKHEERMPELQGYLKAVQEVHKDFAPKCRVMECIILRQGKEPPEGLEMPQSLTNEDFDDLLILSHEAERLMQPLVKWQKDESNCYEEWEKEYDAFTEQLEAYQDDAYSVYQNWGTGTIDITALSKDDEEFKEHTGELFKRHMALDKEYSDFVEGYNEMCEELTRYITATNEMAKKVDEMLRNSPNNPDNISLN